VADARKRRGLTQQRLAELAQISFDTVKEIEQGRRTRVKAETWDRLCEVLGVESLEGLSLYGA
jgi:transcriptional regulator with XRE-family HTH domain